MQVDGKYENASKANIDESLNNRDLIVFLRRLLEMQMNLGIHFYFVGGCVRDAMLGNKTFDIDIAVDGELARVREVLSPSYDLTASILDTAKLDFGSYQVDLAQFRSELYEQNNGLPTVLEGDLQSDIMRRDFTINTGYLLISEASIAWMTEDEHKSEIELTHAHPSFHEDIKNRTLRFLHENSFVEDASRLLRAVKYITLNQLNMDTMTEVAFKQAIASRIIEQYSPNRYRQIILSYLEHKRGIELWMALHRQGLLIGANPNFEFKAFELALDYTVDLNPWEIKSLLLLLLYEANLTFWYEADKKISQSAKNCATLIHDLNRGEVMTKFDFYQILTKVNPSCIAFLRMTNQVSQNIKDSITDFLTNGLSIKLWINGNDLLALGMNPGKEIGTALNLLLEYEVNSGLNLSREEEIEWIESYMYEHRD